jgi:hypothetical protein
MGDAHTKSFISEMLFLKNVTSKVSLSTLELIKYMTRIYLSLYHESSQYTVITIMSSIYLPVANMQHVQSHVVNQAKDMRTWQTYMIIVATVTSKKSDPLRCFPGNLLDSHKSRERTPGPFSIHRFS